jgi:hypothetical protein
MQSIYVHLIINAMNLNQMQVLSTSLLSMKKSNADTKENEVKRSNKKHTQNNDKTQRMQTMKEEITQQSLRMSSKKQNSS